MNQYNHSFFIVNDTVYGWGVTSFYSYFVSYNRDDANLRYVEAALMILLMILAWLANICTCILLISIKRLRRIINYFITNLCIATIIYLTQGLFIASSIMHGQWVYGLFACKFSTAVPCIADVVSIWIQTLISISRYRAIMRPTGWQFGQRSAWLSCAAAWVVNAAVISPLFIYTRTYTVDVGNGDSFTFCTIGWPYSDTFRLSNLLFGWIIIMGGIVPIVTIVYCYVRILHTIHKTQGALHAHAVRERKGSECATSNYELNETTTTTVSQSNEEPNGVPNTTAEKVGTKKKSTPRTYSTNSLRSTARVGNRRQKERKRTRTIVLLLLLLALFVLSWLPVLLVLAVVQAQIDTESPSVRSRDFVWAVISTFIGAVLNPVIYAFVNENFRKAMDEIPCALPCRKRITRLARSLSR